jgi:hypothetical protein
MTSRREAANPAEAGSHNHAACGVAAQRTARRVSCGVLAVAALLGWSTPAAAQLDPLLFLKRTKPNVILVVDTAERMQRDADGAYYDPADYPKTGALWELGIGVNNFNTSTRYRRKYEQLQFIPGGGDRYSTTNIATTGNAAANLTAYNNFYAKTRLQVAKDAMRQAIADNSASARFGLIKTRQQSPAMPGSLGNEFPVYSSNASQQGATEWSNARWKLTRPTVGTSNRTLEPGDSYLSLLVKADVATANTDVTTIVNRSLTTAGALLPAGRDDLNVDDAPLAHLLDDAKAEAQRLIAADTQCRNTVVVLIVGGGEGTGGHTPTAASTATGFRNVASGRRVPIYVIAIAPPASAVSELQSVAANSGGQYFEITKAQIDAAAAAGTPVPEAVRAIDTAVQHAFANPADVNTLPTAALPYGPQSEFQVTSPIVGTVDLYQARFIDGTSIPDSESRIKSSAGTAIPQRSNLMVTSAFALPGFEAKLRGFRVYKPVVDTTKPSGYRFDADGKALWVARPLMLGDGVTVDAARRNIYTVLPNGTVVPFDSANASQFGTYLNTSDVAGLIDFVRGQPIGAIVGSTPAILDAPSLDPPPDGDYPKFVQDNKDRRGLVFVGANDGMMHAFDARTGLEVWAFVPFNLLPKLKAYRDGQGIDAFAYFVDSSPKIADVKVDDKWRTYLFFGEGPGGTFYQTLDITLDGIASSVGPTDDVSAVLSYFSTASRIPFVWAFPKYTSFDTSLGTFGDLRSTASAGEKSVGQTWSDPAVGQIEGPSGSYALVVGSGFFPYSAQQTASRGGAVAGTAFYVLSAKDGTLFDIRDVGSDNKAESVDDCANASPKGCTELKNALQADPVAAGPPDSRFITKAYIGDLDGKLWRFDIGLNSSGIPVFKGNPTKLYTGTADQPLFSSMAAVTVGTKQYLFFGTGSDLLSSVGVSGSYKLIGLLEGNAQPSFTVSLTKTDGLADDEKVSAFPAVAGDIVFFTTTNYKPAAPCSSPDANLYAFTFIGGAAYDSTGDNKVSNNESPKVKTLAGAGRATAPFIVDQHLWFGNGSKIEMFGDSQDFNNGVGQVGVRILSWRSLR